VEYDCEPVADFDPDAPRYTCSPTTPAPTDSPSPNHGLLGVAMVAGTAAYKRIGGRP
jgi:hypothetical protein